ncbi:MAG: heme-degrading domain-containing protein [Actinomycetales bacterium]
MNHEPVQLTRFGHDEAWQLGRALVETCRRDGHAVVVSITLGEQRVFHAAMPGTSADNDGWAERKSRVVRRFARSSLAVYHDLVQHNPAFFEDFALTRGEYAPYGGAVPIVVSGCVVGVLAVSGLESTQDHELAVAALHVEATRQQQQ